MPFLKSIKTIALPCQYSTGPPRSPVSDWAWLGFAIFHPDVVNNSVFQTFSVDLKSISLADLEALRRMATGNNLLSDSDSSWWIEGYVPSTAQVWTDPRDDADLLHTFRGAAWVSLCVASAEILVSQEWLCAVIPGYGLGWIRCIEVVETRWRPPGKSRIRALRVSVGWPVAVTKLTDLLTTVGRYLTTLAIYNALRASTVETIARLCPALKVLRIEHDGSFWAEDRPVMPMPCLEGVVVGEHSYQSSVTTTTESVAC